MKTMLKFFGLDTPADVIRLISFLGVVGALGFFWIATP